ncbi:hypothetical protein SAMN02745784_02209 [Tissierella praeacuta DSM 18095]|uniref:Uncharacterized protein n=1 Tax=Tissierella praeacuta DSM 18095 TaxID=1123404 RepID=A0A1M4XEF7_9FIRM|nr:hypothetical protein [Tissierella praeacuta]TCU67761.1 hypothetical protein EV204_1114 [Tissierella praeacuta]SHE91803.1 hypothetical protein SAMN02745784_02209 [Tissierella praeacuta DSM 18095]SUP02219.1 Uncharacterised protein [Tissierella praeacuta]
MKRKISLLMVIVMMLSFTTGVFADGVEQEKLVITLEDGTKVSERQFIEILEFYEGEIYKISSDINVLEGPINNIQVRSVANITMDEVMTIMAGTWMIPGIGKVVVTGGAILVGGIALYKVSSETASKVKSWLIARAEVKETEERVKEVLKGKIKDRKTGGDTHVYKGSGGKRAAERDFNKLNQGKTTTYSNGTKVGQLPDGTKINVRPGSSNVSGNKPTLEIQGKGKHKIKIRY